MAELYSHSRLSSFEDCPKKFEYRYKLKIPAETEGIEGYVGRRVHEVLERLYVAADRGQVPSLEKVIRRYGILWDENWNPDRVRIVRSENSVAFYRESGERCLSDYYRQHYPFDADETLGIEERVTFALDPQGAYRVQGIIDRIVRARDGAIEIHDYKTAQRLPRQEQVDRDRQLALYQIGLGDRFGADRPFRLVWHFLKHNRTRTSTRSPEQLQELREGTMRLIDRIRAEREFEPRTGPLCRWCEYNDRCPAVNTPADASHDRDAPAAVPSTPAARASTPAVVPPTPAARAPASPSPEAEPAQLSLL